MLEQLTVDEKLRLLRFMCSFAWADLQISAKERELVADIVGRMGLPAADAERALTWLDRPPSEEELDPYDIPDEHRRLFLEAALDVMGADGRVDALEAESFALFELLVDEGSAPTRR